jgi:glycogen debranching enzyme
VRDAYVAIWDEVTPPDSVDALGLNCMLVREEWALAQMARELGLDGEASSFQQQADARAERIRRRMWDGETGFFYHNDMNADGFTVHKSGDLKRREIIGFLPLWAGVASEEQAERLVRDHLTDPESFWREHGVPSLAADDPYYDPKGYWNGPVWVQWNALIVRGLLDYGYDEEARELARRVARGMAGTARETNTLWEFYGPDEPWGGWHQTYIWAGLVNDMLLRTSGTAHR